jgi:hypothetical protein
MMKTKQATLYCVKRDAVREIVGVGENSSWVGAAQQTAWGDAADTLTACGWSWSTNHSGCHGNDDWQESIDWRSGWPWSTGGDD